MRVILIGVVWNFSQCSERHTEKIRFTGSSTIAPIIAELGPLFEKQNPRVRVDVETGGSGRGLRDAKANKTDFGMVSRAVLSEELEGLKAIAIASDGLGFIVHQKNPLRDITRAQVKQIYTGQVRQWSDITPKRKGPITVVHKSEGRATLDVFLKAFHLQNKNIKPTIIIGENQEAIKAVSGNELAIAYVSIGSAEEEIRNGAPVRLLKFDGHPATTEEVSMKKYPVRRELNLVYRAPLSKSAQEFLNFLFAETGVQVISRHGFIPVGDSREKKE